MKSYSSLRKDWASLRDSERELSTGDRGEEEVWAGAVDAGPENKPCVVKGVRVHRQRMNECHPPPTQPTPQAPTSILCLFLFWRVFPTFPLLLYHGISLRGRNPPHWGLRGCIMRINELEVKCAVCHTIAVRPKAFIKNEDGLFLQMHISMLFSVLFTSFGFQKLFQKVEHTPLSNLKHYGSSQSCV